MTKGVAPSAEVGLASSQKVQLGSTLSSSPSQAVLLESRNSPASVLSHMPSFSNPIAAYRQTVPEDSHTTPLRTRVALLPQSYGNGSGSSHQAARDTVGSVRSQVRSPRPVPDGELQTVPPCLDTAAGGLVKHSRMAHAGPEVPHVPDGHFAAAFLTKNLQQISKWSFDGNYP